MKVASFVLFPILLVCLYSCTPKTAQRTVEIDIADRFSRSGSITASDKWWTSFEDGTLNALVDSALSNNYDLLTAWQRILESRSILDIESSFRLPKVSGTIQAARSFPEPDFVGGENVRLGISADYEVDIWGRIKSRIEAERYRTEANLADYHATAISLSAEVTRLWFRLKEASAQIELLNQQIRNNESILELLENRFGSGMVRAVDIIRQKQLIKQGQEQKTYLEAQLATLEHQILVITGRSPQFDLEANPDGLPVLPPMPETGITTDLLQRRPDVINAYMSLQAADRDLATALSNQYPRLSLNVSTSLRSNNFDNLFREWAYSFASNLFAPIFLGNELKAEVDRSSSIKDQQLYQYGQVILTALREVEDALILEEKQKEAIVYLEAQIEFATQAYEQLRTEYFNGISNYLDVLTALNQTQQLRRDLVNANLVLLEYRIALYRSLAGGFEISRIGENRKQ